MHWTDVAVLGMDRNFYLNGERVILNEDKTCYEPYVETEAVAPELIVSLQDVVEVVPVAA